MGFAEPPSNNMLMPRMEQSMVKWVDLEKWYKDRIKALEKPIRDTVDLTTNESDGSETEDMGQPDAHSTARHADNNESHL